MLRVRTRMRSGGTSLEAAIRVLFAAGEAGAWFDPSDLSTLFQDSAGTTPVTAVGQPVGKILDKSGRGNHATQATAASRPLWQQDANGKYYLAFDGVDDWLQTGSVDLTAIQKLTVVAGVRKNSDAALGMVVTSSTSGTATAGEFGLFAPRDITTLAYAARLTGTALSNTDLNFRLVAAPDLVVLNAAYDLGAADGAQMTVRHNGGGQLIGGSGIGSGTFKSGPVYIGMRGGATLPFNGRLYSLIVRAALSTSDQIAQVEQYVNKRTGAY